MKKYFSKLTLAIVLALVMGLAFAGVAMATPVPLTDAQATLGITKRIDMDTGTALPESNFQFRFTQLVMTADGLVPRVNVPTTTIDARPITNQSIGFPHAHYSNPAQTSIGLNSLTWPHAGQFFFMIDEIPNTNAAITANPNRVMTYDTSQFLLIVTVSNVVVDGNEVTRITGIQTGRLEGGPTYTPGPSGGPGTWGPGYWLPPTEKDGEGTYRPGEYIPDPDGPGTWVTDPSRVLFVNEYVNNEPPPLNDDPTQVALLSVEKRVGANRGYADLTTPFTFDLTLTVGPTAVAAHFATTNTFTLPNTITAHVQNYVPGASGAPGTWVDVAPPVSHTFTGDFTAPVGATPGSITYTSPAPAGFQLTDGQRLRFPDTVPAGTTVLLTERGQANWRLQAATFDGRTHASWTAAAGTYGNPATVNTTQLDPIGTVVRAGSTLELTNGFFWSPVSGLFVGSMPFMVALLGATVLLAMMVASRSRQRIEQLPIAY